MVAAALFGLGGNGDPAAAAGLCGAAGCGMILFFSTGQAAVQLGADPRHRGKAMGVWAMAMSLGVPAGNVVFGPAADAWGVGRVVVAQGAVMAAAAAFVLLGGVGAVGRTPTLAAAPEATPPGGTRDRPRGRRRAGGLSR